MNTQCKETRDNYWLVADQTISTESLRAYNEHLKNCNECRKYFQENDEILKELNLLPVYDLDEKVYKNMLAKLGKRRNWITELSSLNKKKPTPGSYLRYAFTGIIIIVTLVLVFFFNSKKELNKIGKPVISLDWKAEKIEHNIKRIDSSLIIIKTKTINRNIYQNDPWKSDIYLLARDIEKLQMELEKSTL